MKTEKRKVHFTDMDLLTAANPVSVNLIGAGGTGSKVLTALLELNHCLNALGHPGLSVRLWDDDVVTTANEGRQRFAQSEVGLKKSVALINRANRWSGTNWKAKTRKFEKDSRGRLPDHAQANITITCVDTVKARFGVAEILKQVSRRMNYRDEAKYWMDFGNSRHTGQVILSTIGNIKQPKSLKYQTVENFPLITEEFGDLLTCSEELDDTPSCSLAEALQKQDLYINAALAQMGCSLLWDMFRDGLTENRGFFLNLKTYQSQALKAT